MNQVSCKSCGADIPAERLELLPHTTHCVSCSTTPAYRGMMSYGHKTGGAVQPMAPNLFREMRRYTYRKGKRSNMGSFFSRV